MLRKLAPILSLVLMAVLAVAPAAMAENKVEGSFDLTWNGCWEGPNDEVPDWIGTIDIDGDVYDMLFFKLSNGRPPNQALPETQGSFIEIWAIYDGLELVFDDKCAIETYDGDLALWGHDYGTSDKVAATYEMTGTVVEAFGDFADLAGGSVTMNGTFAENDEGVMEAPGVFQVN